MGISVSDWVEEHFDSCEYTGNGDEVHVNCPRCGDTRKRLYINTRKLVAHCHNCDWSPRLVKLIAYVEGITYKEAEHKIESVGYTLTTTQSTKLTERIMAILSADDYTPEKTVIPIPKEVVPLFPSTSLAQDKAYEYLKSRGFTKSLIQQCRIVYCYLGDYSGRVIIPTFYQGRLVHWIARAIDKDAKVKEKSPLSSSFQISKSQVLWNLDSALKTGILILTEGIFDAIAYRDYGVALLGKKLYDAQLKILCKHRSEIKKIYVSLDADASKDTLLVAEELASVFPDIRIIHIPKELDDPNNTLVQKGVEGITELIKNATPYFGMSVLDRIMMFSGK